MASVPIQEGDVVDHPLLGPTPVISVYSRQMAIEDGTLVDCTEGEFDEITRQAGLKVDVAITSAAFDRYVDTLAVIGRSRRMNWRYRDVLWGFREAALKAVDLEELTFKFHCIPNGEGDHSNETPGFDSAHRLVTLKAISHPGDRGEPCITIMLPDED